MFYTFRYFIQIGSLNKNSILKIIIIINIYATMHLDFAYAPSRSRASPYMSKNKKAGLEVTFHPTFYFYPCMAHCQREYYLFVNVLIS